MILFCVLSASYIEITLEATISRFFSHLNIDEIFNICILSGSYNLADADPAGTLESCSGTKNEQKNTHNNMI